jgi:predicted 2-oxoglutarate/Fe(II)-dependent dioxygenase YbiX
MVAINLLLQGGHSDLVELDEEDPVLAELIVTLARRNDQGLASPPKLFNLTCKRSGHSLVFSDSALVALIASPALELASEASPDHLPIDPSRTPALIIDDFLQAESNSWLLSFIGSNRHRFSHAKTGGQFAESRSGRTIDNVPELRELMMLQILPLLPAICTQFHLSYTAIEKFECQVTSYGDGDFYRPHIDLVDLPDADSGAPPHGAQRLVSYTYYLHAVPKKYLGGDLTIFAPADGDKTRATIESKNNRIVFFPSNVLHEVTPVSMPDGDVESSRLSVNGWIRCQT